MYLTFLLQNCSIILRYFQHIYFIPWECIRFCYYQTKIANAFLEVCWFHHIRSKDCSITLRSTQYVAFEEGLVFSQFKCAEFKSEVSFFLQATDFNKFWIFINKEKTSIAIIYYDFCHETAYITRKKQKNKKCYTLKYTIDIRASQKQFSAT